MFLEIKQIKKAFGQGESRVEVLRGIDLSLERGEFCVLLGPSGSGKSHVPYEGKTADNVPQKASGVYFSDV